MSGPLSLAEERAARDCGVQTCPALASIVWHRPIVCLFVGCLTSQQHASVSLGRICTDNFTCCHTEIEVADQTFYLTQSQYTDTGPTSPSADPIMQGSHWSANFEVTGMTRPRKNPGASGIRTQDLPLSRRTPYQQAKEVVGTERVIVEGKACWDTQGRMYGGKGGRGRESDRHRWRVDGGNGERG